MTPPAKRRRNGDRAPEVTLQQLIDAGINAFGLELFVESLAKKKDVATFEPFAFRFRGVRITIEPDK